MIKPDIPAPRPPRPPFTDPTATDRRGRAWRFARDVAIALVLTALAIVVIGAAFGMFAGDSPRPQARLIFPICSRIVTPAPCHSPGWWVAWNNTSSRRDAPG